MNLKLKNNTVLDNFMHRLLIFAKFRSTFSIKNNDKIRAAFNDLLGTPPDI